MNTTIIITAIELGFIFALMSSGILITFRIMNFPDLSVDGSFTLGCAVGCVFATLGHPILGIGLAFMAGCLSGLFTGLLHTVLKVQYILAGIITMTALYSVNLRVAGDVPNFSLFGKETIFSLFEKYTNDVFQNYSDIILLIFLLIIIFSMIILFFKSPIGLALRATGDNENMVRASSIDTNKMKCLGLALSNGLVSMAAAIYGQYQLFFDIQLGIGMMVVGLTGIIIGETIFGKKSILNYLVALTLGSIIYRMLLTAALDFGMKASDWKLLSALLVTFVISLPVIKNHIQGWKRRNVRN